MSFETDIRSRLAALAVTPERLEAVTAMRETVRRRCRPALDRYFASWDKLPAFGQVTPDNRRDLAAAQAEFFDRLFSGEMDAAYVDRLRALVGQEETNGFGVRIHLAAAANLLLELFEEIGRDRRWSGIKTARMCSDVLRFMVVDTLNAFHIGQELLKQRVVDRREAIDGALGEFGTAAVELQDSMADASRTFSATSEATAAAIAAALVAAERTGEAADRGQENLLTTAGASAQLVSSIGEVDRLASHSLDAVRLATANVGSLKQEIGELDRAATAIGSVVTLIAGVASQTNLLALNATIEAARAGEAGRGFSVVAAEVKTLAGQTAEATRAIAAQIGAIQAASTRSGEQLAAIVSVIARVEEMSAAAAAATSEQALATASIADQAQAASDAVGTIRAAATAMRELMGELRTTATGMDEASQRLSANGDRFQTELGRLSERLTAA